MLIKQEHQDLWLHHVPTGADITPHASDKLTSQQTPWTGEVSVWGAGSACLKLPRSALQDPPKRLFPYNDPDKRIRQLPSPVFVSWHPE